MNVHYSTENLKIKNPVLTVGTFDGVHVGHKKIISTLIEDAKKINGESVIFSLSPHPRKVLFPETEAVFLLNTEEEKIKRIEKSGIDRLIIYPFTKEFAALSSCEFIEKILFEKLKVKKLIVGHDHHFGKDREGREEVLKACADRFGISVIKVGAHLIDGKTVSSTKIRNALINGDIDTANTFLGYNYVLSGVVTEGNQIGREMGFPTANLLIQSDKLIPKNGVYAVSGSVKNKEYGGMLNIGINPTVNSDKKRSIEVHLFKFSENLYGQEISVELKSYIRNEKKFDSTNALKKQLYIDKETCLTILNK